MIAAVVTTIAEPTASLTKLAGSLASGGHRLTVVGDAKGPASFALPGSDFFSLADQQKMSFVLSAVLPVGHYTRKNIGYLCAMRKSPESIYETDDDNAPLESWTIRELTATVRQVRVDGWLNVYKYFTNEFIWPRGLPLDQVRNGVHTPADSHGALQGVEAPIQQGLADNSPDVDAVWRLLHDKPITFDRRPSVCLRPGTWCPFNSQSTWWWPQAYPLMYLPSFCSFRMTDIWRSFVAQRCLWEMGYGVVFHAAEVYQERNPHDLMKDFEAEIPGYRGNQAFVDVLADTSLKPGVGNALDNLVHCYERLIEAGFFPDKEMELVRAWAQDIEPLMSSFDCSE
ncbi:MAG TPA: STELLO glycosyltransferase family protein [Sedimentisphaerales bacterium]|nr:STELLO glycosyltransferase family protein [Sedimentisphaerales bacterium]